MNAGARGMPGRFTSAGVDAAQARSCSAWVGDRRWPSA